MTTTKKRMSAAEFFEASGDERSLELVQGEMVEMPDGGGVHGDVGQRINVPLFHHVESAGLGKVPLPGTGFALDPHTVRKPDIAYIERDRCHGPVPTGFYPFAPTLAIEVVSPSDKAWEVEGKALEYLEAGTREVWVVYPLSRTVQIWSARGKVRTLTTDDALGSDLLPGFALAVSSIFG